MYISLFLLHLSLGAYIYVQYFFDVMRNQTSNKVTRVNQKKMKSSLKKICRMNVI